MLIDGRKIAEFLSAHIAEDVKVFQLAEGRPPRLAAVLVGDHVGSRKFLELKRIAAEKLGIEFRIYEFPENVTTQKLRKEIVGITKSGVNDGVIIELPLPVNINAQYILNAISIDKDVDALSEKSQGSFFVGRAIVLPPAVEAVKTIFQKYEIQPKGKNCVVFGYGLLVGRPISHWLGHEGATVSILNEFTVDAIEFSRRADIIISGVGKPGLVTADMVKEGAIVIDFGYENTGGRIAGDIDFEGVKNISSLITPVPGGVGPVVITAVFKNLLLLTGVRKSTT